MVGASFRAFADELVKIAEDEARIYAPGIVAHEAGHAKVHGSKGRDMALQYGRLGGGIALQALAGRLKNTPSNREKVLAGALALDAMQLGDEYASTLIGLKKLKDEGKLTKGERAHEVIRQTGAGLSYATTPASRLLHAIRDSEVRKKVGVGVAAGGIAGLVAATTHTGPKVTAREAKELVKSISPDTDVYASKKPISGGSLYMHKSYTPIGRGMVYLTSRAMGMDKKDSESIANKGGVIVAPVSPVGTIGLSLAHEAVTNVVQKGVGSVAGPLVGSLVPVPNLTLPGAKIKKVE